MDKNCLNCGYSRTLGQKSSSPGVIICMYPGKSSPFPCRKNEYQWWISEEEKEIHNTIEQKGW